MTSLDMQTTHVASKYDSTGSVNDGVTSTRLPPVVENFRSADTVGRSRVKAKSVRLYDTTPVQVISLSVVMPGCSPGPSEWHYSKLDMNSSKIDRIENDIAMPGCSPGPSLQQMYCNQSKPSVQNHRFDEKLQFCDVLATTAHFVQVAVVKYTRNGQLGGRHEHVWQGGRYHADVNIWGPESRIWWKTDRFVTFWPSPHILFKS